VAREGGSPGPRSAADVGKRRPGSDAELTRLGSVHRHDRARSDSDFGRRADLLRRGPLDDRESLFGVEVRHAEGDDAGCVAIARTGRLRS
jgi:hypothetical protein